MAEQIYGLKLTDDQQKAVDMALELSKTHKAEALVGILTGFAGTGKTTTLRAVVGALGDAVVLAPTGKAALRVKEATGLDATTIHRWMYIPVEDKNTGDTVFQLRDPESVHCPSSRIVIVDEASMISPDGCQELLDMCAMLQCNVIFVGDPFQLPPVVEREGANSLTVLDPHVPAFKRVHLDKVFRQALDNPIIRISMLVRQGQVGAAMKLWSPATSWESAIAITDTCAASGDVVICHRNVTRHRINAAVRARRKLAPELQPGEPLLVLRNCYDLERFNGEIVKFHKWDRLLEKPVKVLDKVKNREVESAYGIANIEGDKAILAMAGVYGQMEAFTYRAICIGATNAFKENHASPKILVKKYGKTFERPAPLVLANFGYALTCHKSQGSEWDRVLVFLERSLNLGTTEGRRWLYTAVTRAKKNVAYFSM